MNGVWWITRPDDASAAATAAGTVLDAFVRGGERDFGLALSGGRVAPLFFREWVRQARARGVDVRAVDYFWCDERCVPPDHEDSNFRVVRQELLEPLAVPPERVHRLEGEREPGMGAAQAMEDWGVWTEGRRRRGRNPGWDVAVLGVGEDGHVASLFPGNLPVDLAATAAFRAVRGPKPPPDRLTAGYGVLWEAERVVVLATGRGKEEVVRASLSGTRDTPLARVVAGREGRETVVITDF